VKLVLENPFRVLGLSAAASTRDIAKRVSDLETFAELGKTKSFPTDFPSFGKIIRTVDTVRTAAKKIEQQENKLLYSFFWFRIGHEVDQAALEALSAGHYEEAFAAWESELSKNGPRRYTSRLNSAVLNLCLSDQTEGSAYFISAMESIGFLMDDYLAESVKDVLGSYAGLNKVSLWEKVADSVTDCGKNLKNTPFGSHGLGLLKHNWTWPLASTDYMYTSLVNPHVEKIETAIELNELLLDENSDSLETLKKSPLRKVEPLLLELQNALGQDDPKFQAVANAFALALVNTAIYLENSHKHTELASSYITWAYNTPSFGQVTEKIASNKIIIEGNLAFSKRSARIQPLVEQMQFKMRTFNQAEAQLEKFKYSLATLKLKKNAEEDWMELSDSCVGIIQGFIVSTLNKALSEIKTSSEGEYFCRIAQEGVVILGNAKTLYMSNETRQRLELNERLIRSHIIDIKKKTKRFSIPWWVWVVGFFILIAMSQ
jgi:hypothetical protein